MKNIFLLILYIEVFVMHNMKGQTLINALPLEYNPSFAGSAGNARIAASGYLDRNQSSSSFGSGSFLRLNSSSGISYDQFLNKLHMGIGLTLNYSQDDGQIVYHSTYLKNDGQIGYQLNNIKSHYKLLSGGIAISPKFSIKGKYTFAPSIQGLFGKSERNNHYYFGPLEGEYLKVRAGILFNTKRFYAGYTIDILNSLYGATKYAYTFYSDTSNWEYPIRRGLNKIPFNSNIQLGYTFQKKETSKFSFTPQLIIYLRKRNQFSSESLGSKILNNTVINLNFKYSRFLAGVLLGSSNLGLTVGYQSKNIKLMYVLYRINGLNGQISLRYTFKSKSENSFPSN